MTQDRSTLVTSRERGALVPGDARARLDNSLDLLRREWRDGCPAGNAYAMALGNVRRLRHLATSEQMASDLGAVIAELERYPSLDLEPRRAALTTTAAAVKRLIPQMAALDAQYRPPESVPETKTTSRRRSSPRPTPTVPVPVATQQFTLDDPITTLKGAGGATSKKLAKLGILTIGDLLFLSPRRHIDYSRTIRIGEALNLRPGSDVTVRGRITDVQLHRGPGAPRVTIKLADQSGWVRVTWFNQFLASVLHAGDEIAVSGALESGYGPLSFTSPEWERISVDADGGVSTGRIIPVYPLTAGLAQKSMRGFARQALAGGLPAIEEHLPAAILAPDRELFPELLPLRDAVAQVHFPDDLEQLEKAKTRLGFDELFLLQLGLLRRKQERQAFNGVPLASDHDLLTQWRTGLPFRLTQGQEKSLSEILADMTQLKPMARLLQGDVGSGKTAVAAGAILVAAANAYQAAFMAPTEILAEQHLQNFGALFAHLPESSRPRVRLLTGATRKTERQGILDGLLAGDIDVLIGTHALIQEGVQIPRLALSVVDEQHRFGVRQRGALLGTASGQLPHQLAMTATPIPRTLNLVLHGDLDVSVLSERPPGRVPVETRRYIGSERNVAYALVRQEVAAGRQVFVLCPLVEESEAIEAKAAVAEAERLRREVFPDLRIATLHGRMKSREKDAVMTAFRDRRFDLLVSTSVIEVGIDVPNATVMLVEGADRFGLAQLHQFRGRVGRGGAKSYCLLLAEEGSADGEQRLQAMVASDDGFALAETDLQLRGPGDFIGTRQSGLPEMSWLDGVFDTRLLERARSAAATLLSADPNLEHPDHRRLAERLSDFWERAAPEKAV